MREHHTAAASTIGRHQTVPTFLQAALNSDCVHPAEPHDDLTLLAATRTIGWTAEMAASAPPLGG